MVLRYRPEKIITLAPELWHIDELREHFFFGSPLSLVSLARLALQFSVCLNFFGTSEIFITEKS